MDIFGRFARDPACLVAIDAADGGRWRSPFRSGVVYPSAVPRNFATENASWTDFNVVQPLSRNINVALDLLFYWDYDNYPGANVLLFGYSATENAFYVQCYADGSISVFSNLFGSSYGYIPLKQPGAALSRGFHRIYCTAIDNVFSAKLDTNTTLTQTAGRRYNQTFYAPSSKFSGYFTSAVFTDLTNNKILWSYPSFEEKTRLITKANIWTGNGFFEAASSGSAWSIKYAAPAPTGDYTAVIDTTAVVITQVRKSLIATTYTNGVSGGTLPYLTLGTSTLTGAYGTKLRHFLLFDRALSTGEIQILR